MEIGGPFRVRRSRRVFPGVEILIRGRVASDAIYDQQSLNLLIKKTRSGRFGMREVRAAKVSDLKDGEMKEIVLGETKALLARVGGSFYAIGATCPHYGGPLAGGALCGGRVICPLHHASFDVKTGDLLEPPALDALPRYEVRVEGDRVLVSLPDESSDQGADRRTPPMADLNEARDGRVFVILGGGAAGYMAAQTLREEGFEGRVLMISREDRMPYDRPNLSKDYLQGHAEPEWMPLRPDEFFTEHGIEVMREKEVAQVDAGAREISFADGGALEYDALLVATGGAPRELPNHPAGAANVFALRSFADSDAIVAAAAASSRAVVIGASFIAMEVASSLVGRGCSVTIVAPGTVPFQKTLGEEIGALFRRLHEEQGARFRLGASVAGFEGAGKVEAVKLADGERLEADLVVVGVGVKPATEFLKGVELSEDGGVVVDEHLRAAGGFYAAGDIANFPSALTGGRQRIEHWRTALQQGRVAARNMAGKPVKYDSVPFFWTRQFDASLSYVGHAEKWDEIIFHGAVSAQNFLAFYVKDNRVLAVAGMNRDREMAALEGLMLEGRAPTPDQLRGEAVDLEALLGVSG
jgi:NADPH-dependent 2,4-dienoyl-CoA reductase/sulfur reductase-like enzyme/nitrite reductase/ring-hydroxylating ferredoxin subunit